MALTRARAISVFRQCVTALFMVKDEHPKATKEAIASVIPVWLDAFRILLSLDPTNDVKTDHWDELTIRMEVFKVIKDTISLHHYS